MTAILPVSPLPLDDGPERPEDRAVRLAALSADIRKRLSQVPVRQLPPIPVEVTTRPWRATLLVSLVAIAGIGVGVAAIMHPELFRQQAKTQKANVAVEAPKAPAAAPSAAVAATPVQPAAASSTTAAAPATSPPAVAAASTVAAPAQPAMPPPATATPVEPPKEAAVPLPPAAAVEPTPPATVEPRQEKPSEAAGTVPAIDQELNWQEVQEIQKRLQALNIDPGPLDGVKGPRTIAAVRRFQESRGEPVTGDINQATLRQLKQATSQ